MARHAALSPKVTAKIWAGSMPTSAAPMRSFATARIALPVSVSASNAHSPRLVTHATPKPIAFGTLRKTKPRSSVEKP